jgi:hypothetical protein
VVIQTAAGRGKAEIALSMGVSESAIVQVLSKFEPVFSRLKDVDNYRATQGKLLDAAALQLLESIADPTCIAESKLNQRAYAFDKVAQQSRLVQGLSTANVSSRSETLIKVTTKPHD